MISKIDTNTLLHLFLSDSEHMEYTAEYLHMSEIKHASEYIGHPLPEMLTQPHNLNAEIYSVRTSGFLYEIEEEVREELLFPIVICRCLLSASHYTKRSGWPMYQLIYTHDGRGKLYLKDHLYPLKPGSFCLLDCREYHYFFADCPNGWEYSFIHFDGPGAKRLFRAATANTVVWENMQDSPANQLYSQLTALNEYEGSDFDLRFHRLMTELLYALIEAGPGPLGERTRLPEWLSVTQTYILEHFMQSITVEQLAAMVHLSASQFSHGFKRFLGVSPIRYQYQVRINQARTYLAESDFSIEQISEMVGFHNVPNFYSVFRSIAGDTPSKYRKRAQMTDGG